MGAYLHSQGYSHGFINNYVVPMCAAVWSVPKAQVGPPSATASCPGAQPCGARQTAQMGLPSVVLLMDSCADL